MARPTPVLLALCAVLAIAPTASAATMGEANAAATGVRAALTRSASSGTVPAPDATRYRASISLTLKVLGALDQPSKRTRFNELAAPLKVMGAMARRGTLTAPRFPEAFRQLDANRIWFASRNPPAALARVQVPGDPIIYGYYPGSGLVLQPLFNATQANTYWFAKDYASMTALVDALEPLAVEQKGGWLAWEYLFDYGGGLSPWRSGMAQGVMLQVLARTWQATQDPRYLQLAKRLLPGFSTSTRDGGLLDPGGGMWWPLYAFNPGQRVLNGDLQVLISLYDYAALTGDLTVKAWADQGALTALAVMPQYDTGAWSRYDQRNEATLDYHDLMTLQLGQLAGKSGLTRFRDYQQRFALYRVTPPTLIPDVQYAPARFYPAPVDGFLDRGALPVFLDKRATLTMRVTDSFGKVVAATKLGRFARGRVSITWNGLVAGKPAPDGQYSIDVMAADIVGNKSPYQSVGTVEIARDVTPPALRTLRLGRSADGRVRLRWAVVDAETPTVAITVRIGNRTARLVRAATSGAATFALPAPKGAFTAEVQVADTSGNVVDVTRRPA